MAKLFVYKVDYGRAPASGCATSRVGQGIKDNMSHARTRLSIDKSHVCMAMENKETKDLFLIFGPADG
ncbi:hypothetical protein H4R18_003372, partial [Coemansia javaensis]